MITVRYFAAARAAAGTSEEQLPSATLGELVDALADRHGPRLTAVLRVASFLVDGVTWRDRDRPLPDPTTVDVLPPFAGG